MTKPHPEKIYHSVTFRCVEFIRPHLRLIIGAALMGVGKFTLPLASPFAFKYVIDALLTSPAKLDGTTRIIDRWCITLAHFIGEAPTPTSKLAVLSLVMLALYALQSVASYYRNYWAGIAGNRLIFDLQCRLFSHLQRLPHSFFDQNPTGSIVSRVLHDVQQANELVGAAVIDVWMDGVSLILVVFALFALDSRLALVALCIAPMGVGVLGFFPPRV